MKFKLFSQWIKESGLNVNERSARRHRQKLDVGIIKNLPGGGIGHYLTEDEFKQIIRSMGK